MTQNDNQNFGYLGQTFQLKLLSQLFSDRKFSERIINVIQTKYFDNPNYKQIVVFIKDYFDTYENIPTYDNIMQVVSIEISDPIQREYLHSLIKEIKSQSLEDSRFIQERSLKFCKQQALKKTLQYCNHVMEKGEFENYDELEEKLRETLNIAEENDDGVEVMSGIENVLEEDYRNPIPTGIKGIDKITGGGLSKGELAIILGGTGFGKSQPLSAKVLTPNGWKLMGDIKPKDEVIGSNGKSQRVLATFPQGDRPIYKVEFNDGSYTHCDEEHLWSVNSIRQRKKKYDKRNGRNDESDLSFKEKKTKDLIGDLTIAGRLNYRIPLISNPVEFDTTKENLLINPYVLGIMLGDGHMKRSSFNTIDEEIINEVKNLYDGEINVFDRCREVEKNIDGQLVLEERKIKEVSILKGHEKFRKLGIRDCISNNKFIPKEYKVSTVKNRIELLQGILDSDGSASKQTGSIEYTSISKTLIEDVRELVLSLRGYCSKINNRIPTYKDKLGFKKEGQTSYRISISFCKDDNIKPFKLKRKLDLVSYRDKYSDNRFIKNIKYSHEEEAQCILVENQDHLYVTDDYILTHNTTMLTKIANTSRNQGKNVLQIIFEDLPKEIQRKHISCWTGIPINDLSDNKEKVLKKLSEVPTEGKLIIKRFSSDNTTMNKIKNYIKRLLSQGIKIDVVLLDYLDCVTPNNKYSDINVGEGSVIRSFESMLYELDLVGWTAVQSGRAGLSSDVIHLDNMGGSIKRAQVGHLVISIARSLQQKELGLATIAILKSRFGMDGIVFENCTFDNSRVFIDTSKKNIITTFDYEEEKNDGESPTNRNRVFAALDKMNKKKENREN